MTTSVPVHRCSDAPYVPPMSTLAERIEALVAKSGLSKRQFSIKAGLGETHISTILRRLKEDPESTVEMATLEAIAKAGGIPVIELVDNTGEETTPAPHAIVPVRQQHYIEHAFSDDVEALGQEVVRIDTEGRYNFRHVRAGKVYVQTMQPRMDVADRLSVMLGAVETARQLDEEEIEPTPSAILARLTAQSAPKVSLRALEAGKARLQALLDKADADNEREGVFAPGTPSSAPASPAPTTAPKSSHTRPKSPSKRKGSR